MRRERRFDFAAALFQLAGLLAVFHFYRLLDARFTACLAIVILGAALQPVVSEPRRKLAFLAVSVIAAFAALKAGAVFLLLGAAALLWLVTLLPMTALRVGGAALLVAALAVVRARSGAVLVSEEFWRFFGGIFGLRLLLYMRERETSGPQPALDFFTYFLMAPNFYFHLFPVVDYAAFRRTYSPKFQTESLRAGADWILRGSLHLLAQRLIESRFAIAPSDVHSLPTLLWYSFYVFSAFLRLSGSFHISIGMLRLFGFGLPRPCDNFLLARDPADYWRRINVYWKDFMSKLVYVPVFFRFLYRGRVAATLAAAAAVFLATWLLHGWQSFWVVGRFSWRLNEFIYWCLMGSGVVAALLWRGRPAALETQGSPRWTAAALVAVLLNAAFVALLWGLWSMPSLSSWLCLLRRALW